MQITNKLFELKDVDKVILLNDLIFISSLFSVLPGCKADPLNCTMDDYVNLNENENA